MKKCLWLLLLLLYIPNISAKTYYSEYTDYSEPTLSVIPSNELINVKINKQYRYFHRNRIDGNYYRRNENPDKYPFIDENNFHKTIFSSWNQIQPLEKPERIIEKREAYQYQERKGVRYIHLENVEGGHGIFQLVEFSVKVGEEELPYTVECNHCSKDFENYIHNGIIKETQSYIENGNSVIFDLGQEVPLDQIRIFISLFDDINVPKKFRIAMTYDKNSQHAILQGYYNRAFSYLFLSQIIPLEFSYQNRQLQLGMEIWDKPQISLEPISDNFNQKVIPVIQYRYQDTVYRYYQEQVEISDYLNEPTDYYYEKSQDYRTYYQYRTREKIEIADSFVLTPTNSLQDILLEHTTSVVIDDKDIQYSKNGKYPLYLHTPFMTITTFITVDNPHNMVIEKENFLNYQKMILSYKTNNQIYHQIQNIQKLITEYQHIIDDLHNQIQVQHHDFEKENIEKDNHIIALKSVLKSTEEDNQKLKQEKVVVQTKSSPLYYRYIFGGIFLLISIGLWKKFKKKSNE